MLELLPCTQIYLEEWFRSLNIAHREVKTTIRNLINIGECFVFLCWTSEMSDYCRHHSQQSWCAKMCDIYIAKLGAETKLMIKKSLMLHKKNAQLATHNNLFTKLVLLNVNKQKTNHQVRFSLSFSVCVFLVFWYENESKKSCDYPVGELYPASFPKFWNYSVRIVPSHFGRPDAPHRPPM